MIAVTGPEADPLRRSVVGVPPYVVPAIRPHGVLFASHHPWLYLALLVVVVAVVWWQRRNSR